MSNYLFVRTFKCNPLRRRLRDILVTAVVGYTCTIGFVDRCRGDEDESKVEQTIAAKVDVRKLTLHPMAESKPSLKIQFVPDSFDQLDGNSAVFYMKAMGFLEQNGARDRLREIEKAATEKSKETGKDLDDIAPFSYLHTAPKDYPKGEVREYLNLLSFQTSSLRDARRQRHFSMHRNLSLAENPIGFLIPEIPVMRDLARKQSVRCRLAIAEGRIEDAIQIIGQQLTMAKHLGMDDFLISALVGNAIEGIALHDTLYLIEQTDCPNLYWAFAQLPNPVVSFEQSYAGERQFAYLQIPGMRNIGTEIKSDAYWTEFLADFAKQTSEIDTNHEGDSPYITKVQGEGRAAAMQKEIEDNYLQAKDYLIHRGILSKELVESYPKVQVGLLAMKVYFDDARDDVFKWMHVPYGVANENFGKLADQFKRDREQMGWFTGLAITFLPSIANAYSAQVRSQQKLAMVQAVEAIRMAGAANGGKLIETLDAAPVPVPVDPFTGKPFVYKVTGKVATISAELPVNNPPKFELEFAR